MNNLDKVAQENMETRFVDNPHRGIVVGMNGGGDRVQLPWIMGRSSNSQNRVYAVEDDILRTEPFDPSKVKDPSLIIYNAMRSVNGASIVTNGVQTDTVYEAFNGHHGIVPEYFFGTLEQHYCEPDPPTFTPRISGYQYNRSPALAFLSILRPDAAAKEHWLNTIEKYNLKVDGFESRKEFNDEVSRLSGLDWNKFPTERDCFERSLRSGIGYCLTTYRPGHETLDSFDDTPFIVPTKGPLEDIMQNFWEHLEPEWRVALGGKVIYSDCNYRMATPINRFEKKEG